MTLSYYNDEKRNLMEQIRIDAVKYDLYLKFEQEYNKIVNAYHNAFAEAQSDDEKSGSWPETYRFFFDRMKAALNQWKEYGYKEEIDAALLRFSTNKCFPVVMKSMVPTRTVTAISAA